MTVKRRGARRECARGARVVMLALALMAALALAAACGGGGDEPPSGPRLALASDTFDLGVVKIGEPTERAIEFRNEGSEPLMVSIVKVRPAPNADCGCGVEEYRVEPQTVPPGGSGRLVFLLKAPEGMSGMQDEMLAELASNDPAAPTTIVAFKFQMLP